MIDSCGLDFESLHNSAGGGKPVLDVLIGPEKPVVIGKAQAQLIPEKHSQQVISEGDLMADPYTPDIPEGPRRSANPLHRIGQVDQQGSRAEFIHILQDGKNDGQVTAGVNESRRAAVLRIVTDVIF